MTRQIAVSLKLLLLLTLLTGVLYPLLVQGVAEAFFPREARGSMLSRGGTDAGSALIGQQFRSPTYFWPRPSAVGYSPTPSGGTNLGPTSGALRDSVAARRTAFIAFQRLPVDSEVPAEMLFASGSGVDPHVSPASARAQVDRVARARGWDAGRTFALRGLVERSIEGPQFGLFGEPRVNILRLNLALDALGEL